MATLLVGVLLLVGCDLLFPPQDAGLDGEWRLVGGTHSGDPLPLPDDAPITLTVTDGEVGGRAACNLYGGEITIDGDRIEIGVLSVTEMACDPAVMDAESAYLAALADVERWARDDDRLTLSGEVVELTYDLVPPVADADLVGTTWVLDGLISGDAISSTMGERATLELADDGTISGSTGCRTFSGRYELNDSSVTVTELANDDRACPGLESQDEHVLAVIGDGFGAAVDGNRLTLTDGDLGLGYLAEE
jgi:heat shock protein HslJ